jgi:pyruvate,water dikinase
VLRFLFKYNEIYSSLRDNHRYYYDRVWWMLRRYFVEAGRRLHKSGLIGAPDDVFFLVRGEHAALVRGELPASVAAERVRVRREEWLATRREQPPKFLRRGYAPDDNWLPAADRGRLTGLAASPGEARGPARIVYDVAELSRLSPGDVLVTRQTDPSWTPAFARVGGLVLETGGVLAHGASLCREFGLPCVTAVERATQLIHEGDIIAISGSSGTIELISRADGSAPDLG